VEQLYDPGQVGSSEMGTGWTVVCARPLRSVSYCRHLVELSLSKTWLWEVRNTIWNLLSIAGG